MATLVRSEQPSNDIDTLRARVAELEAVLRDREAEAEQVKADLATFKGRYRDKVGHLHEELESLEDAIAEIELGEITRRLDQAGRAAQDDAADADADSAPQYTGDAVRKLFRDVARAIHPDLAEDDLARQRRHALMVEANRAYELGDEERLRLILEAWEKSPEAVQGDDPEATRLRLERRVAQIEAQLDVYAAQLAEMRESAIWKLKAMVDEAAAKGSDLIADTVRRLRRDIMVARNRLEAMQSRP
ncbi:MAG: hypothetical protein AB7P99_06715 [Vicinamibacterales bacterium]